MIKCKKSRLVNIPNAKDPPLRPARDPPQPIHDKEFYCLVELVKTVGRRTKDHDWVYRIIYTPWDLINNSELINLCLKKEVNFKEKIKLWEIAYRGLTRDTLIGIIVGEINAEELTGNPVHQKRQDLQMLMHENWRRIWSQIGCSTECWECTDVKVLECVLENYESLPGDCK